MIIRKKVAAGTICTYLDSLELGDSTALASKAEAVSLPFGGEDSTGVVQQPEVFVTSVGESSSNGQCIDIVDGRRARDLETEASGSLSRNGGEDGHKGDDGRRQHP